MILGEDGKVSIEEFEVETKTSLTKVFAVEYAHRLLHHLGQCHNLHGHTGHVRIVMKGPVDPKTGMIADFSDVKMVLGGVIGLLDHAVVLNSQDPLFDSLSGHDLSIVLLDDLEPTAENLAEWLLYRLNHEITGWVDSGEGAAGDWSGRCVTDVVFAETANNAAACTMVGCVINDE